MPAISGAYVDGGQDRAELVWTHATVEGVADAELALMVLAPAFDLPVGQQRAGAGAASGDACDKQVRDGFGWLDAQFAGPWFTGAEMTQADVTVAVFWLFGRAKRPRFFAGLGCTKLEALAERLQDTPEFQATLPEPEILARELG